MDIEELLNEVAAQLLVRGDIRIIRQLRNLANQILDETNDDLVRHGEVAVKPSAKPESEIAASKASKNNEPPANPKLQAIRQRCELKSEAAFWAAKRIRLLAERRNFANEIEPHDIAIIKKAKLLDCYLWMCSPTRPGPSNPKQYEEVGEYFLALSEAIQLVESVLNHKGRRIHEIKSSLALLAEAQSALRASVEKIGGPVDSEQAEIFYWLRSVTTLQQIYLERHLRLDDPGTASGRDIMSRITQIKSQFQENQKREREKKRLLDKVRHKTKQILNDPKKAQDQWLGVVGCVTDLIRGGMPPSNKELRDLLLPVVEYLPELEEVPKEFELVKREMNIFTDSSNVTDDLQFAAQPSREVAEVAKLLKGKSVVIIGGDYRPAAMKAIRSAFGLKEVVLVETNSHDSYQSFIPIVSRPDVALVALAIRWASHSFKEIEMVCDDLGIPLVRLPGGMNPNQIAAQILAQASKRLGKS